MSLRDFVAGAIDARVRYGVKVALDLPGTEYGPRYADRRWDDAARTKDQVGRIFDDLPGYDPDSHFPMPGTGNVASG